MNKENQPLQAFAILKKWMTDFLGCGCAEGQVFSVLLASSLVYRFLLGALLISKTNILFPEASPMETLAIIAGTLIFDLLTAAIAAAVVGLARLGFRKTGFAPPSRAWRFFGWSILVIIFGFVGFTLATQMRLLIVMNSGFTVDVMLEALSAMSPGDMMGYSDPIDSVLAAVPVLLFLLFQFFSSKHPRIMTRSMTIILGVVLTLSVLGSVGRSCFDSHVSRAVNSHPAAFFMQDLANSILRSEGRFEAIERQLAVPDHKHAYLTQPEFNAQQLFAPAPSPAPSSAVDKNQWNIMIFILESVGEEYVFDTSRGNEVPMPFLKSVRDGGLSFENHFATGNTSPRAIFSMFTGLYPLPEAAMFSTRNDLAIPSLMTHVKYSKDKFIVTPGRLESYFPQYLFRNAGFEELYDFYDVPDTRQSWGQGRNELDGVDFFIKRLARAKEPFWGIYYSYAPHYPYNDYGKEFQVLPDNNNLLHRYYNNLRLLDRQIERIFVQIKTDGQLQNTIFVFVGDHGEAFGRHPGNYTHPRFSFNENYKVPAIIYQPALFEPQQVSEFTSHVDLLPTLLDALGIDFDPLDMQGESILRRPLRRKYIFAYGNEGTLVSIRKDGLKVLLNPKQNTCETYELMADPLEENPLDCDAHQEQVEASLKFKKFQSSFLRSYNEQCISAGGQD